MTNQTRQQKETELKINIIKMRIFNRRNLKKAFTERELREMLSNDNFYKPETLWFTKEMIESDLPRIIKIIEELKAKLKERENDILPYGRVS